MLKKLLFNKLIPSIYRYYLSINVKTEQLKIEDRAKCLCLAPHADDESIGMAGTLFLNNKNFKVICLTNGIKGAKKYSPEQASEVRKKEFTSAMKIASIKDFEFLDIDDKHIIESFEKFSTIDIENYDYIFIPNILDQHVDHKSVALNLNRLIKIKKVKPELKILMYEVWSSLPMPNVFTNITSVIDKKRMMINSHKSQVELKDYTEKAIGLNSYRGLPHNIDYVEAFVLMDLQTFEKLCKYCV